MHYGKSQRDLVLLRISSNNFKVCVTFDFVLLLRKTNYNLLYSFIVESQKVRTANIL